MAARRTPGDSRATRWASRRRLPHALGTATTLPSGRRPPVRAVVRSGWSGEQGLSTLIELVAPSERSGRSTISHTMRLHDSTGPAVAGATLVVLVERARDAAAAFGGKQPVVTGSGGSSRLRLSWRAAKAERAITPICRRRIASPTSRGAQRLGVPR
jgi:hypothetical protein